MPHESPDFEKRLQQLLDDRRAPEDDVWVQSQSALSHANEELLKGQQLMLDGLELCDVPELPADFAQRCVDTAMERTNQDKAVDHPTAKYATPVGSRRVAAYTIGVCALLALAAAVPVWNWLQGDTGNGAVADNPPTETNPADKMSPTPDIPEITHTPQPDADVPPGVEDDALDAPPNDNLPNTNLPPIDSIGLDDQPTIEELFYDLRERIPPTEGEERFYALVEEVRTGLRPVTDSVGGALNAIRRNIPPTPKSESSEKPQAWMDHNAAGSLS